MLTDADGRISAVYKVEIRVVYATNTLSHQARMKCLMLV